MSSASIELAKHVLMVFGIILALGTASAVLAQKLKMPDVVVFLIIGTLLGPAVAGVIDIKADSALNQLVLIFGSCYILFDGGASLRLKVLKEVWITIVVLATVGVLITAAITGLAAYYLLGVPFIVALLAGRHHRLYRSGNAGAGSAPGEDQGPGGADGNVGIGLQRCHRCHSHVRRARRRHGPGRGFCIDRAP